MRLKSVFVRFYKSFNYDYLRKIKVDEVDRKPWEILNGQFYPFVEIPIDSKITTVVGANESGKSHLLTAIEKGLTGKSNHSKSGSEITRRDFCRYSRFFKSTVGEPQLPDFGFEWTDLKEDLDELRKILSLGPERHFDRFFLFRHDGGQFKVYVPRTDQAGFDELNIEAIPKDFLPHVFRIDSDVALPDRVSISRLIEGRYGEDELWKSGERESVFEAGNRVGEIRELFKSISSISRSQNQGFSGYLLPENMRTQAKALGEALQDSSTSWRSDELRKKALSFNLAYDLIFEIARIDITDVKLLHDALRKGDSGIVRGVTNNINNALNTHLNFPRVWVQDKDFALRIEPTEHELSFIISDRTGCDYAFDERSSGLRHFLSYYIQYLTHKPQGKSEILLMDEPDAFLSGEAQQDLLKVFQMFAEPSIGRGDEVVPVQVIYVTHSPFLIDKNHAERVRALEKAEGAKGSRVISGAAQNHYEPLRSAFGAFVGETTFISGCNLVVEGISDQILLAGCATYLRRLETVPESQLLDLNNITIVPCSGSATVPYLVYLARGRDAEKPAIIVLLDSDKSGNDAKNDLGKNGPHPRKKQILRSDFILQLGDIGSAELESIRTGSPPPEKSTQSSSTSPFKVLEDLIPLSITARAIKKFIKTVYDIEEKDLKWLSEDSVAQSNKEGESFFSTIQIMLAENCKNSNIHIDKVPFARTVVDLLPEIAYERRERPESAETSGLDELECNMRVLFSRLAKMRVQAEKSGKDKRMREKVENKIRTFLSDHSIRKTALRDDIAVLLSDIESDLEGDDAERTFILQSCIRLRSEHKLTEDLYEPVRDYPALVNGLDEIRNAKDYAYSHTTRPVDSLRHSQYERADMSNSSGKNDGTKQLKTKSKKSDVTEIA